MFNLNFAFFYKVISKHTSLDQQDVVNILLNGKNFIQSQLSGTSIDKAVASKYANGKRAVDNDRCLSTLSAQKSDIIERLEELKLQNMDGIVWCYKKLLHENRFDLQLRQTGELLHYSRTMAPLGFICEVYIMSLNQPDPSDIGECDDVDDIDAFIEASSSTNIDFCLTANEIVHSEAMRAYSRYLSRHTNENLLDLDYSNGENLLANDIQKISVYSLQFHFSDSSEKDHLITFCESFGVVPSQYGDIDLYLKFIKRINYIAESFGDDDVCLNIIEECCTGENLDYTDFNCRIPCNFPEILFLTAEASYKIDIETELKNFLLDKEDEQFFDVDYDDDASEAFLELYGVKRDLIYTGINSQIPPNQIRLRMFVLDKL